MTETETPEDRARRDWGAFIAALERYNVPARTVLGAWPYPPGKERKRYIAEWVRLSETGPS